MLISGYIMLALSPLILSVLTLYIINNHFSLHFQTLLAAGISGSIVFATLLLKRWYDRKVVINTIKADLSFYSQVLERTAGPTPTEHTGRDGIVNITPFSSTPIFDSFIDKIGLVELDLAREIMDTYHTIKIFLTTSCLIEGVELVNDHHLYVRANAFNDFRQGAETTKHMIDNLILKI